MNIKAWWEPAKEKHQCCPSVADLIFSVTITQAHFLLLGMKMFFLNVLIKALTFNQNISLAVFLPFLPWIWSSALNLLYTLEYTTRTQRGNSVKGFVSKIYYSIEILKEQGNEEPQRACLHWFDSAQPAWRQYATLCGCLQRHATRFQTYRVSTSYDEARTNYLLAEVSR